MTELKVFAFINIPLVVRNLNISGLVEAYVFNFTCLVIYNAPNPIM